MVLLKLAPNEVWELELTEALDYLDAAKELVSMGSAIFMDILQEGVFGDSDSFADTLAGYRLIKPRPRTIREKYGPAFAAEVEECMRKQAEFLRSRKKESNGTGK